MDLTMPFSSEYQQSVQYIYIIFSHLADAFIQSGLQMRTTDSINCSIKGIVHFEIKIWYLSAYPKGIQDVGVFFFFSRSNFDVFRSNRSSLSVI